MKEKKEVDKMANEYNSAFQLRIRQLLERYQEKTEELGDRATQGQFAAHLGVSLNTLRGWTRGTGQPDTDTLAHIADVENVSADWLIGRQVISNYEQDPTLRKIIDAFKNASPEKKMLLDNFADFLRYSDDTKIGKKSVSK